MRYLVFSVIVAVMSVPCFSDTIHVPTDQPTIQLGIDAATINDMVLVAPGTYFENINFNGKGIIVKSSFGPSNTVIDGSQPNNPNLSSVVTFASNETCDSILEGFTLTNGNGTYCECTPGYWDFCGGGVYVFMSSPTLINNIIISNSASCYGGGVYCSFSGSSISRNTIKANNAGLLGGGVACYNQSFVSIIDNEIINNSARSGGGLIIDESYINISSNIIKNNMASVGSGGGIHSNSYDPTICNNTIVGNSAKTVGGGICCYEDSSPEISGNLINDNHSEHVGGGIYCQGTSSPMIVNNILLDNTSEYGGGIGCLAFVNIEVTNNTIVGNSANHGGGISCNWGSSVSVVNTILHSNNCALTGKEVYIGAKFNSSSCAVEYSNISGGQASVFIDQGSSLIWGKGNLDVDPMFIDKALYDFHIYYNSPCKDSGTNLALNLPSVDFEGDVRISGNSVDIGADEYHRHLYAVGDNSPGGILYVNILGNPWQLSWLFFGAHKLDIPLKSKHGLWYLDWPFIGPFVTTIPQTGICEIPFIVPTSMPVPLDVYLQGSVGEYLTNLYTLSLE